ncbi:hypothetical protein [Oscillibacter ruminantium]|jgi:hypothetical protein
MNGTGPLLRAGFFAKSVSAKKQKRAHDCKKTVSKVLYLQFVYIRPLTIVFSGGTLALALRKNEC